MWTILNFIFHKNHELRTESELEREEVSSFHCPAKSLSLLLEGDFFLPSPFPI